MSSSRAATRQILAQLLAEQLPTVQHVYPHQVADFNGESPVVVVTSAGSAREAFTHKGSQATYRFNLHVFVLYSDTASSWTESDAEDALDAIEQQIASICDAYKKTTVWQHLAYAEASQADGPPPVIAGLEYRHEVIPLAIRVYA